MSAPRDIVRLQLPTPFLVGPVNAYLIRGDALILVDTGAKSDESYAALVEQLREQQVAMADIEAILITHGHLDHMGLLGRLLEESSAPAYAHPCVVERSSHYDTQSDETADFALEVMRELGTPAEEMNPTLEEREAFKMFGEQVTIGNEIEDGQMLFGFQALYVPGHSASDILFFDADSGDLITGDHLLKKINPNPLIRRPDRGGPRPKSLVEYHASLKRTRALPAKICYPGHGEPFHDHVRIVDSLLARHERRSQDVLGYLSDGPLTPYEVSKKLFPELEVKHIFFGLSVALGHLELLEERGAVVRIMDDGICSFDRTDAAVE